MTVGDILVCRWCGITFPQRNTRGPTPKWCTDAHRQAAYRHRLASDEPRIVQRAVKMLRAEGWTCIPPDEDLRASDAIDAWAARFPEVVQPVDVEAGDALASALFGLNAAERDPG